MLKKAFVIKAFSSIHLLFAVHVQSIDKVPLHDHTFTYHLLVVCGGEQAAP